MNPRYCWLLPALLLVSGCRKEERTEAVRFCKVLVQKRADFASVNALENDLLAGARSWCEAITTAGAGRADQLNRNADVASDLANSAAMISTQLGQVRQAVYDEVLQKEFPQSIRFTLIDQLVKRQRFLQEVRTLFEDSARTLREFRQSREYTGDTYPSSVGQLNLILQTYKGPEDVLAQAVTALRKEYGIKDADLGM